MHFGQDFCILFLERIFVFRVAYAGKDGTEVSVTRLQQRARYGSVQLQTEEPEEELHDEEYDDEWPQRMPNSTRRYAALADVKTEVGRATDDVQTGAGQRTYRVNNASGKTTVPPRRTAARSAYTGPQRDAHTDEEDEEPIGVPLPRGGGPRFHWLVFVGMAMFVMLLGWVLLTMVANWWQITQDDLHYGRPRTYQTDQMVGHNDSSSNPSHFIALNLNRRVEIIEFPGGDASKAKIYIGPTLVGPGQDLAPVTLSFRDVTGDGKVDMIVNVEGSHFVFINDGSQFRPAQPSDKVQL